MKRREAKALRWRRRALRRGAGVVAFPFLPLAVMALVVARVWAWIFGLERR